MFNEQEVVVTGAAGFIGSNLCRVLLEQGAKVTGFDNLYSGKMDFIKDPIDNGLNFVHGDIRDQQAIEKSTKKCKFIFHLAAQTSVPFSMEKPKEDCEINVVGTLNVLEAAKKAGARMIFASSCAVYGNPEIRPTPETHRTQPIAFYGLTKLLGENYCRFYHETYNTEIVILRIFNVYGPNCHGAIYDFLNKLRKNPSKLEVLGTGKQSRDFVYVSDMVDALLKAASTPKAAGQEFNIGTGTTTSVTEIAKMLIELLGLDTEIYLKGGIAWAGDMDITLADNSKAKSVLLWEPQIALKEGLKKLISSGRY